MPIITEQTAGHSKRVNLKKNCRKERTFSSRQSPRPLATYRFPTTHRSQTAKPAQVVCARLKSNAGDQSFLLSGSLALAIDEVEGKRQSKKGWCRSCQHLASPRKHVPSTRKQKAHHNYHNSKIARIESSTKMTTKDLNSTFFFLTWEVKISIWWQTAKREREKKAEKHSPVHRSIARFSDVLNDNRRPCWLMRRYRHKNSQHLILVKINSGYWI